MIEMLRPKSGRENVFSGEAPMLARPVLMIFLYEQLAFAEERFFCFILFTIA